MDFTTGTAPWWYVAALAGGFTILGGVITLLGGYFSDRRKLRREDLRQWDRELIGVAVKVVELTDKVSKIRRLRTNTDLPPEELLQLLAELEAAGLQLEIIAPKSVAKRYVELSAAASSRILGDTPPIDKAMMEIRNHDNARTEFVSSVRQALRLGS